jgi:hypothetical protein
MSSVEDALKKKLNKEDFELAANLLKSPTSKIRDLIEDKISEALQD